MMHSVTADQSIVRCNMKAKKRDRVKTVMRSLRPQDVYFTWRQQEYVRGLQCTDVKDISHHHNEQVKKLWGKKKQKQKRNKKQNKWIQATASKTDRQKH